MARVVLNTREARINHLTAMAERNGFTVANNRIYMPIDNDGKTRVNIVYLSDATAGDKMTVSVSDYDPFDGAAETSEVMSYKEFDTTVVANYKKVINLAISVYKLFIDDET